jgi:hypothetical protein
LQAVSAFNLPIAHEILRETLACIAPNQYKNGTFGTPCRVERIAAILLALESLQVFKVGDS